MKKFFVVAGILVMILSGGCTLFFMVSMGSDLTYFLPTGLVIGGIPFAIGLIMYLVAKNNGGKRP